MNLQSGGSAAFTLSGTIAATATGNLVNTATVTPPAGATDPNPGNNSATDTDTINPVADLAITKTDGVTSVNAGGTTVYTIVANNNGPSAVIGATVTDSAPAGLTFGAWTCVASAGSSCPAGGTGNVAVAVNLQSGGSATFSVNATVAANATGSVTNTATVTPPSGTADPTPGNNTATDVDTVVTQVTLTANKTDGSATYTPGSPLTYTITVTNSGPSNAVGATVADARASCYRPTRRAWPPAARPAARSPGRPGKARSGPAGPRSAPAPATRWYSPRRSHLRRR